MYSYIYDETTGGLLLEQSPSDAKISKEPRPVYAAELDNLGFDQYWNYDKQNRVPYLWAESNFYYYRGGRVAKLVGGNLYSAPKIVFVSDKDGNQVEPEANGAALRPVDVKAMVKANQEMLKLIETATVKKIKSAYEKYLKKIDCFHVAISGGKDSAVLLDLVKKSLPKKSYVVIFGDTGMEFPDTYDVIEKVKAECEKEEIPFYTAASHLKPAESWRQFGPPSRVLRWCCHVHKTTPQTLKLREITGKNDYTGLDFVGVRASESSMRAKYEYESYGKKQKGQRSFNPILKWTSAEIWLYTFANNLLINEAYKKGCVRVGCLCCPMGGSRSTFIEGEIYPKEKEGLLSIVREMYDCPKNQPEKTESYVRNGGWNARKNGRDLKNNKLRYVEKKDNGQLIIQLIDPLSDWTEWIKTIGTTWFNSERKECCVQADDEVVAFNVNADNNQNVTVAIDEQILKNKPSFAKYFRQVFHKAAYCAGCKVCEANCKNGRIAFSNGKVQINDCTHCKECHMVSDGCLMFSSLRRQDDKQKVSSSSESLEKKGNATSMEKPKKTNKRRSINIYGSRFPKQELFLNFFTREDFLENPQENQPYQASFAIFLNDASLIEESAKEKGIEAKTENYLSKYHRTEFADLIQSLTWNTETALALMLINLASVNPQTRWFVRTLQVGRKYSRTEFIDLLPSRSYENIINGFKFFVQSSFGNNLHFGSVEMKMNGREVASVTRTKCLVTDSRVLLYGLYKFAEQNDLRYLTLSTLFDNDAEFEGISPTEILGLSRDDVIPMLSGLSSAYPEFIYASFTHDLEKVNLDQDKTSADVLDLFRK